MALMNMNFNFTLLKQEAPAEFLALGSHLSNRRQSAEAGPIHVTACNLKAIFEKLISETPNLIAAYGKRASEIMQSSFNPTGSVQQYGFFSEHVGADGRSIWAAATSGGAVKAIAVHLLACMLARHWKPDEAIAIWEQIIAERQAQLKRALEIEPNLEDLMASGVSISREELANWDASARSWLRTADAAKEQQQIQLRLILENVALPVDTKTKVLDSVVQVWTSAMSMVDRLLGGVPQKVGSGAVLLGLHSWHLYPDMVVLEKSGPKEVCQRDPLMDIGGILTIGLTGNDGVGDIGDQHAGIHWSLPLANLRYYGHPTFSTRSILDNSQLSVAELQQVALGSFARTWNAADRLTMAQFIVTLTHFFKSDDCSYGDPQTESPEDTRRKEAHRAAYVILMGLYLGAQAVQQGSSSAESKISSQLFARGSRKCQEWLTPGRTAPPPWFGLSDPAVWVSLLLPLDRVPLLRQLAQNYSLDGTGIIIRYRHQDHSRSQLHWEYATVRPIENSTPGGSRPSSGLQHQRWISFSSHTEPGKREEYLAQRSLETGDHCIDADLTSFPTDDFGGYPVDAEFSPFLELSAVYTLVAGDPETAAIWTTDLTGQNSLPADAITTSLPLVIGCLEKKKFDVGELALYFQSLCIDVHQLSPFAVSLISLAHAAQVFEESPRRCISFLCTYRELYKQPKWFSSFDTKTFPSCPRNREETFSCLLFFESGWLSEDPKIFKNVLAISTADSIYVSKRILKDPLEGARNDCVGVARIVGNVGRPGFALLIPPEKPMVREETLEWRVINHEPFDCRPANSFGSTSLHLSFTGYETPVDVRAHGTRHCEAFILESHLSIREGSEWVADVDALAALEGDRVFVLPARNECTIHNSQQCEFSDRIVSIDSWNEYLDPPERFGTVKAHGNWVARLAAACLGPQISRRIAILPPEVCWTCVDEVEAVKSEGSILVF
ncbi:hypothetical protein K440DRAFT_662258 [Wilcoxina mikolae CBS 423.85]|nr:hypothetical protein K440DRAFT_662258 [Wilcoxina mikolae CBS 423.85]